MALGGATIIFYVSSSSGSDMNDGSFASPWKSIQKAADTLKAGDTVYVRGGTYREKIKMNVSGAADAYIMFRNFEGETPIIDGSGLGVSNSPSSCSLIHIADRSYIKVIGFTISHLVSTDSKVPAGVRIIGASKNIEIRNNRISGIKTTYNGSKDRNAHGIAAYGTNGTSALDGLVIDDCEVYGCILGQSESVVLNGNVTDFKVTNNRIHDNDNIGIDFIGYEGTAPSNDHARYGICSGNEIWNITSGRNPTYGGEKCANGIYVDGGSNIIIESNKVWNVDIGIECASEHAGRSTSHIIVRNNLVYNCSGNAGLSIGGSENSNGSADHVAFYNNTVYNNRYNLIFQSHCQDSSNIVRNNIFYHCTRRNISGKQNNITVSNNITDDPHFISAGTDFHLSANSIAIDAGMNDADIGSTDFDGNPRISGGTVDCGCFEKQ